jgi:hypothetical protein
MSTWFFEVSAAERYCRIANIHELAPFECLHPIGSSACEKGISC